MRHPCMESLRRRLHSHWQNPLDASSCGPTFDAQHGGFQVETWRMKTAMLLDKYAFFIRGRQQITMQSQALADVLFHMGSGWISWFESD